MFTQARVNDSQPHKLEQVIEHRELLETGLKTGKNMSILQKGKISLVIFIRFPAGFYFSGSWGVAERVLHR